MKEDSTPPIFTKPVNQASECEPGSSFSTSLAYEQASYNLSGSWTYFMLLSQLDKRGINCVISLISRKLPIKCKVASNRRSNTIFHAQRARRRSFLATKPFVIALYPLTNEGFMQFLCNEIIFCMSSMLPCTAYQITLRRDCLQKSLELAVSFNSFNY